jgi:hypothetical protein
MSQETLTPLCQAAQVNLIRPIASFHGPNPPAHEAQTPPSIASMTATLAGCSLIGIARGYRETRRPRVQNEGLVIDAVEKCEPRHDGCLAFFPWP